MQDKNSIPTQTFAEETLVSPYANDSEVSQAESLLKQVGNVNAEPVAYNPGNSNNFLFGRSVVQIFAIAAVLIGLIIGVAAIGVLRSTGNGNGNGDGQALLASLGNSRQKDDRQQVINNSILEINRSTVFNQNFAAKGDVLVQSNQDSGQAFQIQSSVGDNIMVADTKGKKITIGDQPPGNVSLAVNGDITTNGALVSTGGYSLSSQGLTIGGVLVCTSRGCVSNSSPPPTPSSPSIDVANLMYLNTNQMISGAKSFGAATVFNAGVTVNSPLQVAGNINSTAGFSVNGNAGASFSCPAGQLLQQAVVSGGIITSGTCVTIAGGTTPTLQDVYDASSPANLVLSSASGVFSIQDAASPLATNLFEVGSNGNSTLYFAVNNLGISVTGNVNTTGLYQVGGVQISSANLSNDTNLAKLNANQTFSGNNTFSSASNSFTGDGSGLTNVNAVQLNGQSGAFYQNATNINAGTLSDARLSNNVALLDALQTFTGANAFSNASNSFTGDGSGLSNVDAAKLGGQLPSYYTNASNISNGTLDDARLSANVTLAGNTFNGANELVQLTAGGILPILNGSNLTALNASNISSGTLSDARLSANVALLDADNIFLGDDSFHLNSTALTVQDAVSPLAGNLFEVTDSTGATKYFEVSAAGVKINGNDVCTTAGNCTGVSGGAIGGSGTAGKIAKFTGSGFTIGDSLLSESGSVVAVGGSINIATGNTYQINGSQISSAALSNDSNLAKLDGSQTFTGANTFSNASNSFTGNGSGLTNLNASNVSSGTLNDARLSSNVALKNANNTFTGDNVFSLLNNPLSVQDAATPLGTDLFEVTDNTGTTKYFTVSATALQFNGEDVCTAAGNCTGVTGIGGSGTAGKLAKFTGTGTSIGDSLISDNGTTVTVGGVLAVNTITPTATLTIGTPTQTLTLQGDASSSLSAKSGSFTNTLVFAAPAVASHTITIPNASGTVAVSASGPLSLDAAGNLTCPTCLTTGGSGGTAGVTSVNSLTGDISLAGTLNQIIITPSSNTLTFSLPQDISTTSTPDFAGIDIGGSPISSSDLSDGSNLAKLDADQTFTGANTFSNASNSFTGDGSGLTSLNASNVSSGTLNDARLSSNVALLNRTGQIFTGDNTFKVDSSSAFQVQNASGGNLLNVDTSNGNIILNGLNSAQTGAWTIQAGNLLPGNVSAAGHAQANGYIYVLGGYSGGATPLNSVYYAKLNADGSTGAWQSANNLPQNRSLPSAVAVNGYLYLLGGENDTFNSTNTVYYAKLNADGSTGAWQSANNLPDIRSLTTTAAYNGYIYLLGGYKSGSTDTNTVYYAKLNADGSLGAWVNQASNLIPQVVENASTVVANGYIYVFGGYVNATAVGNNIFYAKLNADGSTGAWTNQLSNQMPGDREATGAVVMNGYVYVIAGDGDGAYQPTIFYAKLNADGSTGAWTSQASNQLPVSMAGPAIFSANGYIEVVGGFDGTNWLNTVYYASTSRIQVGGSLDLVGLAGGTLTDGGTQSFGSLGGSITAGNITAVGDLAVQGNSSLNGGLSAKGNLSVGGSALFQNSSNSTSAFVVQNANGGRILDIDTATTPNLLSNSNFEYNVNGWSAKGTGATISRTTSQSYFGSASMQVTTGGTANAGVQFPITLSPNTTYSLSFYEKGLTSFNTLIFGRQDVSGTDINCQTVPWFAGPYSAYSDTWFNQACTFTTGATITSSNIYIKDTGTNHTLYIDGVQLEQASLPTPYNDGGQIYLNGPVGGLTQFTGNIQIGNDFRNVINSSEFSISQAFTSSSNYPSASSVSANFRGTTDDTGGAGESVGAFQYSNHNLGFLDGIDVNSENIGTGTVDQLTGLSAFAGNELGGTVNKQIAIKGVSENDSGTVTNAIALQGQVVNYGSIQNAYGLNILAADKESGTITNNFGINVEYQTGGTNNVALNLQGSVNPILKISGEGATTFRNNTNSATAFQVQDSTGSPLFNIDTTARSASGGNLIKIGNSTGTDVDTTILVVDSTTAVPTSNLGTLNGGLFYNSTTNHVNVIENGAIKELCNKTDLGCGNAPTTTLQQAYDNSSSPATITTSSAAKTVLLKAGASSDANNLFTVQNAAGGSVFQVDSVNRYVGINNSSPNAALDVNASSVGFTFGFETGTLGAFNTSSSGQGTPATASNSSPRTGSYSAYLGNWTALNGGQIDMTLTKTLSAAGTVSFWCKGNLLTGNGDSSSFLIDGVVQNTNGCFTASYTQLSFAVGSGAHTFDWRVVSGFWQSANMYVDDVQVTNAAGTPTAAIINGGNVGIGTTAPNSTLDVAGTFHLQAATNSASLFQIQNASAADTLFTVDSSTRSASGGNLIKVGNNTGTDVDTTILVVDSATAAPTSNLGVLNGGLFYNSTTNHLNVIENGTVKELCNKTDLGCGSAATPTLAQVYGYGASTSDSVLSLDTTRGGVVVKDSLGGIGGTLFGVQSSTGTKYLDVTSAGISTTNLSVAAGGYISIAGGNTASRPGAPTEGMLYYDSSTKSLLVYANGKWQADRSSSTKIVAMGTATGCTGSSPVSSLNADSADYVVTGCTSAQTTINSAITALGSTGGTVYLEEGTYIIDGQINMASNVTLAGSGPGTVLKLKDGINAGINTVVSSSVSRVTFRDFKLDGNRTNNTSGTQNGLYMSTVGSGSGTSAVPGYTVDNVTIQNFRSSGIYLNGSANSSITRNNIINNGGEGIHAQWPTSNVFLTINGNTVQGNSSYGIYSDISAITYSTISNNTLISNSNDGIYMNGNNNSIGSNTIYANSGKGIELQGGNNTVTGNNVSSNTNDGIYTHGANNTISGNTSVSNSGFGIDTDNVSSNNSVSGNKVSGNSSGGINLGGSTNQASANTVISNTNIGIKVVGSNNTVSGNTVSANTTTGIYVNCCNSNNNIVSSNQVSSNGSNGITVDASNGNQISNNRIHDNGGSGSSSSILIFANAFNTPDKNIIKDNVITDTAGTGYAIELSGGLKPTNTYISGNSFSGTGATAILDTGTTGTTYINQSKSATSDYLYRFGTDSATAFQVQNAGGADTLFTVDSTARSASGGNLIKIGNGTGTDVDTTILVVDSAAAAPTSNLGALNGGLFYNSTTGHINVIEGGAVKELCNKTDLGCGSASPLTTLSASYTNGSSAADQTLALSSGDGGGLVIQDASTTVGNLLTIQNNAQNVNYFNVTSGGISTTNVSVAANGTISLAGGATGSRPGSPTAGTLFYDTSTNQLLQYNGTKWVSDRSTATKIVAAGGASQTAKDSADYVGDGTNDQNAINSAITALPAAGGSIVLLEGTYNLSGTITANKSNVSIVGQGNNTVLKRMFDETVANNSGVITITADNLTFQSIYIDGNKATYTNTNNHGILSSSKHNNIKVINSTITNGAGTAINSVWNILDGSGFGSGWLISGDVISSNLNGVSVDRTTGDITGNTVSSNTGFGIGYGTSGTGTHVMIQGNFVVSNGGNGITGAEDNSSIVNNVVKNNGSEGITVSGTNSVVSGNTVAGTTSYAIRLNGTNLTATGNNVSNNSSSGVFIQGAYANVTGNVVYQNAGKGIETNGGSNSTIANNTVENNGGSGASNGIEIANGSPSHVSIIGNSITDTAGTGAAISIAATASDTYLSGNTYSGTGAATISDSGVRTVYDNQITSSNGFLNKVGVDSTSAFQVQNSGGTNLLNVDSTNARIGVDVTYTAMSAPTQNNTSTSTTGGSLAADTYYYKITAIDAAGGETTPSAEKSQVTTGSTSTVTLSWVPVSGASGYKIYRSALSGTGSGGEVYLISTLGTVNGANLNYIDNGSITPGTTTPPASTTAYTSTNNSNSALQLSVGGLGKPTGQLYVGGVLPSTNYGYVPVSGTGAAIVQGNYMYTAGTSGLLNVYDISNPGAIVLVGSVATNPNPLGTPSMQATGNYLFLESYATGTQIFDISNPSSPSVVGTLGINQGKLIVSGNYLYISNASPTPIIYIYDISKISSPKLVNQITATGVLALNFMEFNNNYLYTAQGGNMVVYNVSNPSAPSLVSNTSVNSTMFSVKVVGRFAYTESQTGGGSQSLKIYDVSSPAAPALMGSASLNSGVNGLNLVVGHYAYPSSGTSFQVVDISNPIQPVVLGTTSSAGRVFGINGRYIYTLRQDTNIQSYDVGGAFIQSVESGNITTGDITVNSNSTFLGSASFANGLQVTGGADLNGNTGIGGGLNVQGSSVLGGGLSSLAAPTTPTVTPQGTTGAQRWDYTITAVNAYGGETLASTAGTTATGNATLSGTNFNRVTWSAVSGATSYKIYRVFTTGATSPTTTGLVGSTTSTTFDDTGFAAAGSAPTVNTTGQLTVLGSSFFQAQTASTIPITIQAASSQTADLLDINSSTGANIFGINSSTITFYGTNTNAATFANTSGNPLTINQGNGITLSGNAFIGKFGGYTFTNADSTRTNLIINPSATGGQALVSLGDLGSNTALDTLQVAIKGAASQTNDLLQLQNNSGNPLSKFNSNGDLRIGGTNSATSSTAFQVQDSGTAAMLTVDTNNKYVQIGSATTDAAAVLNVLDSYNSGTDPTGVNGAMYYNTSLNAFRCFTNGAWANCNASSTNLQNAYDNSSTPATITTSSSTKGVVIAAGASNDNTSLFKVQNAAGGSLLNIDSINNAISLLGNDSGQLGAWQTNTNTISGRGLLPPVTAVANGYIYTFGGYDGSGYTNTVQYAKLNSDGSTGVFNTTSSLPANTCDQTIVTANGYVYSIGGCTTGGGPVASVYYARMYSDGTLGTWTTSTNPLPAVRYYSAGVYYNGYIYEFGGNNGSTAQSTVYYTKVNSDGSIGAWQTAANALPAAVNEHTAVAANGYAYVIGGGTTVYYAKFNADGSMGTWTTSTNPLPVSRIFFSSVVSNGYIYTIGGGDNAIYFAKLNNNGSTSSWSTNTTTLPAARGYQSSAVYNGYVYVIGGNNNPPVNNTVYYASTARLQVGANLDLIGLQGQNLADAGDISAGSAGGSITAGNITAVGTLQVQGAANFSQSMAVNGNLSVAGQSISLGSSNSGETTAWSTNANSLPAARQNLVSTVVNGYVYAIGGNNGTNAQSSVYYAKLNTNGSTGTWNTNTASLPALSNTPAIASANGYIYIVGGETIVGCCSGSAATYYGKVNSDGSISSWATSSNSLPLTLYVNDSTIVNGYLYTFGGYNNGAGGAQSGVYYTKINADGSIGAWNTNTNALPAARYNSGVFSANGYMYVVGGDPNSGNGGSNTVYYAKINTNGSIGTWTSATNTIPDSVQGHTVGVANGYVYVIGGYDSSLVAVQTVYFAKLNSDGSVGAWSTSINKLPTTLYFAGEAYANGYFYTIGGNITGSPSATVYYASTSRISVGGTLDLIGLGGQNLTESSGSGGDLAANNGVFVGGLQVQGAAGFAQSMSVTGNLSVSGSSIVLGDTSGQLGAWATNQYALGCTTVGCGSPATRNNISSVTANGYVYTIGGVSSGSAQSTVYYAKLNSDGSTGAWSTNANALPDLRWGQLSMVANGYVYVIGGGNNSGSAQTTVYYAKLNSDGSTGAWSTNANALPAGRFKASGAVANGYIYVLGGNTTTGGTQLGTSTVYYAKLNADGSVGAWSTSSNTLLAALWEQKSVVANGYIYVIGGTVGSTGQSTVYYAKLNSDGSTGAWSTNANPLTAARQNFSSVVSNGYVYVLGGGDVSNAAQATVYYAKLNNDGSTSTWSTNANALPAVRNNAAAVTANGYVYLVTGDNGSQQSTVYYASAARVQIGANLDLVGLQGQTLADGGDSSAGSTGGSITAGNGTFVGALQVQGSASFAQGLSVTGNFSVNNVLYADSTNMTITLGQASATPVLLVLGNKNTSGDPACTEGAIYYNSSAKQFRACVNSTWVAFGSPIVKTVYNTPVGGMTSATTATFNNNTTARCGMFNIAGQITVNSISFRATAVTTAGTISLGVYSEDGQTQYFNVTTASISVPGVVTTSVSSVTLTPGNYYMCGVPVGTANITANFWAEGMGSNDIQPAGKYPTQGPLTVAASTLPATFDPATITFSNSNLVSARLDN